MQRFPIGTRVIVINKGEGRLAKAGQVGTVIELSTQPWVVFDEPTGSAESYRPYRGAVDHSLVRIGHMDAVWRVDLEEFMGHEPDVWELPEVLLPTQGIW